MTNKITTVFVTTKFYEILEPKVEMTQKLQPLDVKALFLRQKLNLKKKNQEYKMKGLHFSNFKILSFSIKVTFLTVTVVSNLQFYV